MLFNYFFIAKNLGWTKLILQHVFSECWFTFYVCGFHDKALHGHALGNQQLSSSSGPASWCCLFETAVSSKTVRRCLLWCLEKKGPTKLILVGPFLSIHALRDWTVCIILHHECNHANQVQRASWFWWFFWNFLLGNHEGGGIDESSCRSYKEQTLAMHLWAVKCLEINRYDMLLKSCLFFCIGALAANPQLKGLLTRL